MDTAIVFEWLILFSGFNLLLAVPDVFKKGHKGCGSPPDMVLSECRTWDGSCEFAPESRASLGTTCQAVGGRDSGERTRGLLIPEPLK